MGSPRVPVLIVYRVRWGRGIQYSSFGRRRYASITVFVLLYIVARRYALVLPLGRWGLVCGQAVQLWVWGDFSFPMYHVPL